MKGLRDLAHAEIPAQAIEAAETGSEERVLTELPLLSLLLAWVSYMLDGLVEMLVELGDLRRAGLQTFLGLEVAAVGEDGPDLGPTLDLQFLDDRPADVGVVEEPEALVGPVQDFF